MSEFTIKSYQNSRLEDNQMISLVFKVYVEGGFTPLETAQKNFTPTELKKRGDIFLASDSNEIIQGIVICAYPDNPYRQVANTEEAEMHILAVHPSNRSRGLGKLLCLAFETKAKSLSFSHLVLSTQAIMLNAHSLYESLGYKRNPARNWKKNGKSYLVYEKSLET